MGFVRVENSFVHQHGCHVTCLNSIYTLYITRGLINIQSFQYDLHEKILLII